MSHTPKSSIARTFTLIFAYGEPHQADDLYGVLLMGGRVFTISVLPGGHLDETANIDLWSSVRAMQDGFPSLTLEWGPGRDTPVARLMSELCGVAEAE